MTLRCCAEVEARRADEVADVLDEQHVEAGERQFVQRVVDHLRVEVTGVAGRDLHGRHATGANPRRVVLRGEVAFDHARASNSPCSALIVASSSEVLPEPGDDIRFSASTPCGRSARGCARRHGRSRRGSR